MGPINNDIWLINEARSLGSDTELAIAEQILSATRGPDKHSAPLAIRFKNIVVHDNRKWFGEANIRFDSLVVHGPASSATAEDVYTPRTFRFARISDGASLPADNLMIFHGRPRHFLDMFILVSRDTKDSDELASLLSTQLRSEELSNSMGLLLGLAVAAPQVAAITAGLGAAAVIGKAAYDILRQATGNTIGLYRCSWLETRDGFGVGLHPQNGNYRINDLSFRFEVLVDESLDVEYEASEK